MSINFDAIESFCLEITNETSKNIILNLTYRPPNGDVKEFEKQLNKILSTNGIQKKELIMGGNFNMNLLDFEQDKRVQHFLNIMFGHSMMPVINKPIQVNNNTATDIDHIFISSVTTTKFKTGIIKTDISDNFPIFFVADYDIHIRETKERFIYRRYLSDISVENSSANCALLAETVSQTFLIRIRHMTTLLKFLAHFMARASEKRKLN